MKLLNIQALGPILRPENKWWISFVGLASLPMLIACGGSSSSTTCSVSSNGKIPANELYKPVMAQSTAETAYCSTPQTFTPSVTVTGQARFYYRQVLDSGSPTGLGYLVDGKPIRHAEFRLYDSGGQLIQCGETDASGNFSFAAPDTATNLRLEVTSRAANSKNHVSVLNNPTDNSYHSVSHTFNTSGADVNLGSTNLVATTDAIAGAFNILDQILDANDYLRAAVTSGTCSSFGCSAFSVAPKVTAYWTLGKNPAEYFGSSAGLSFYIAGSRQLYILGGVSGNYLDDDTDHFDNSIILHEYGHFLEDVYAQSDSPGGAHSAQSTIDARLAWSEGWADFFQAAVTGDPAYQDTRGNRNGTTSLMINYSVEDMDVDIPQAVGEGNFREFSIARFLWDMIDPHPISAAGTNETVGSAQDSVTAEFAEIWTVFAGNSGLGSNNFRFRSMSLFHELQQALSSASDISSLLTLEAHYPNRRDYASIDKTPGGSCSHTIQATDGSDDGQFHKANHLSSNDFFHVYHPGGTFNISMSYTTNASNPADLDLYVYQEDYVYGSTATMAGASDKTQSTGSAGDTEAVSLCAPAGHYMVNVRYFTGYGLKDAASYTLNVNGEEVCPATN